MLFISIGSLFIALLSLFVSAYNVLRTWERQKFSLNYQITNCFFIPGGDFYAHFEIINNSSEPISITGISINKNICSTDERIILSTKHGPKLKTHQIPIRIESYGATRFYCYFELENNFYFHQGIDLELRTSRGIISSHIETEDGFLLSIADLIEKHKNKANI
ncbi:hypothetical protein PXW92_03680 [Staphylococcus hominis]|uniref:hypothetical protein n=1 Tax=Staphylococcus hominis TaxID=1290 RepID=UPI0012DE9F7F|nr:hypothetical protein [Staphylococcus hominis]MDS0980489.1 hypothetical protein [Staphylococcus hominis]QGR78536.1 hypothetical protein FOC54_00590 [Staphylococcus hominis]